MYVCMCVCVCVFICMHVCICLDQFMCFDVYYCNKNMFIQLFFLYETMMLIIVFQQLSHLLVSF